ncbi:MAG: GIY-YIG nuclease family protein [Bacteroidota bacterium]
MIQPATIKLFLPFGDPTRLRTAELSNWSGKAVAAPRSDLSELYARGELGSSGIYILAGVDTKTGKPIAYAGEAEVLSSRLKQHASKDYWNQVFVFLSKDENLTKAHIRYLEGAIIREAREIGRVELMNAQGSGSMLPESDRADMDVYLSKVRQLLPVLGSNLLTPIVGLASQLSTRVFSTFLKGIRASGAPSSGGFVVFEGSEAVKDNRPSASKYVQAERQRLVDSGNLSPQDNHLRFMQDVEFASPSMAASVVKGGNTNGWTSWKTPDGTSLKEIEALSTPPDA